MEEVREDRLRDLYRSQPCRLLPNALWKTLDRLPEMQVQMEELQGEPREVVIANARELHCFWTRLRRPAEFSAGRFAGNDLLLLHADYLPAVDLSEFSDAAAFFRIAYSPSSTPAVQPLGVFRTVDQNTEIEKIAAFLSRCYPGSSGNAAAIRSWLQYPVYDPALWFWVLTADGTAAGLGIGELDRTVPEGSLEWIQVLPEYRRQGYGRLLVNEMVRRIRPRAGLITVSGRLGNPSDPLHLYRACGFTGDDVWWVLQRKT